ncbi:hypothetical protein KUV50_16735 [Membranicola marinus]|uniref:Arsenate reductase n=1 Tax=Membranihabitans marinus TaxID=1227546 RepID=A0A953LBI7_9BACT|nr:ArsC/Spx/MgsR family protein [Membranihabitans marinus]MBY5959803.1 hypothetical protein [Membranihabitans marinus]
MTITVWHLSTCSTCSRILKELGLSDSNATLKDIKTDPVTKEELESMKANVGSYKALINGRSMQFRTMDKKARDLGEDEAKELLLSHYAFLKRPVIKIDDTYFVGNSKKIVAAAKSKLNHD